MELEAKQVSTKGVGLWFSREKREMLLVENMKHLSLPFQICFFLGYMFIFRGVQYNIYSMAFIRQKHMRTLIELASNVNMT